MFLKSDEEREQIRELAQIDDKIKKDFVFHEFDSNKDNIAGVDGFVKLQQAEIHLIKQRIRAENKNYMQKHPELKRLMNMYMISLLDRRPEDVLTFSGNFFGRENLENFLEILEEKYFKKFK